MQKFCFWDPVGRPEVSDISLSLESQGCRLIPLSHLLLFFWQVVMLFFVSFLLIVHSSDLFLGGVGGEEGYAMQMGVLLN